MRSRVSKEQRQKLLDVLIGSQRLERRKGDGVVIIIVAVVEQNGNTGIAECVFLVFNGILLALKDQHFAFETLKACDGIRCNGRFVSIVPIAAQTSGPWEERMILPPAEVCSGRSMPMLTVLR